MISRTPAHHMLLLLFFSPPPFNLQNKNDSISIRAGCFLDTVTSRTSRLLIWLGVQPSPVLSPHKALNRGRFSMNHRELSNQIDLMPVIKCSRDKVFHLNWDFLCIRFPPPHRVQNAFRARFFFFPFFPTLPRI